MAGTINSGQVAAAYTVPDGIGPALQYLDQVALQREQMAYTRRRQQQQDELQGLQIMDSAFKGLDTATGTPFDELAAAQVSSAKKNLMDYMRKNPNASYSDIWQQSNQQTNGIASGLSRAKQVGGLVDEYVKRAGKEYPQIDETVYRNYLMGKAFRDTDGNVLTSPNINFYSGAELQDPEMRSQLANPAALAQSVQKELAEQYKPAEWVNQSPDGTMVRGKTRPYLTREGEFQTEPVSWGTPGPQVLNPRALLGGLAASDPSYEAWKAKLPKNLQYEGDYNLRALYESNPNASPSGNLHFPDTYKLPNHPTYSNESMGAASQPWLAGRWVSEPNGPAMNDVYRPFDPNNKNTITEPHFFSGGEQPPDESSKNENALSRMMSSSTLSNTARGVPAELLNTLKSRPMFADALALEKRRIKRDHKDVIKGASDSQVEQLAAAQVLNNYGSRDGVEMPKMDFTIPDHRNKVQHQAVMEATARAGLGIRTAQLGIAQERLSLAKQKAAGKKENVLETVPGMIYASRIDPTGQPPAVQAEIKRNQSLVNNSTEKVNVGGVPRRAINLSNMHGQVLHLPGSKQAVTLKLVDMGGGAGEVLAEIPLIYDKINRNWREDVMGAKYYGKRIDETTKRALGMQGTQFGIRHFGEVVVDQDPSDRLQQYDRQWNKGFKTDYDAEWNEAVDDTADIYTEEE